jgi:hypothetical protein
MASFFCGEERLASSDLGEKVEHLFPSSQTDL